MKTPMQELEEFIQSSVKYAQDQIDLWPQQKDYFDGMIFGYRQILNIIDIEAIYDEERVIVDAFLDGYTHSPDEGFPEYAKNYYNEKFNTINNE